MIRRRQPPSNAARLLFACLLAAAAILAQTTQSPIRTAASVRHLNPEQAGKELPVSIRGVITYVNVPTGELFVQDRSAGIFVFIRDSTSTEPLQAGQQVEVAGVTAPGDFSSSITKASIQVIGKSQMPDPVTLPFEEVLTGEQDSQWGHLTGIVRSGHEEAGILYLNAVTSGETFLVIMKDYPAAWSRLYVDSKISLDGVLAAQFNEHRQVTGVRIFVPFRQFVHIDEPAPASPFSLPLSPTVSIGAFRAGQDTHHRIRVRATVTASVSPELMYVSDGEGSLPIELWVPCLKQAGSLVDVVGFPGTIEGRPGLRNAICRVLASGQNVPPIRLSPSEILPRREIHEGTGLTIAKGTRNDLRVITVSGTVVEVLRGTVSQTLTLVSGDQNFTVTIPDNPAAAAAIQPDMRIEVTGLCLIAFDAYHRAQSFRVLARDRSDITVVSRPPWLTLTRAVWIICPLVVIVIGSLVWISVLRRHVAGKTVELREANERLRQISVEDPLTGAANRRRFDELLEAAVAASFRNKVPVSLVMADLDHFKEVNDTYGHQRGDQYLIQVVGALRSALVDVPDALIARLGGEEFGVLLPDTDATAAALLAERMRRSVLDMAISHEQSPVDGRLTVTLGVASFSPAARLSGCDELTSMADRALYQAKEAGRNRVRVFGSYDRPGHDTLVTADQALLSPAQ